MTDIFHIVIVEDDLVTRKRLGALLRQQRYIVSEAEDADQMERIIERDAPDLLLVAINLEGKDGLQITREQRSRSDIAIILLTSRSDQVDRIVGLEMGADDYVTKPFDSRELLARVKALLYRVALYRETKAQQLEPCIRFGGWAFDTGRRRIVKDDGIAFALTRGEFELLKAFTQYSGQVLARSRLLQMVTHRQFVTDTRIVDVLVGRLRRKIERDSSQPDHIITVHGEGYLFVGDDP